MKKISRRSLLRTLAAAGILPFFLGAAHAATGKTALLVASGQFPTNRNLTPLPGTKNDVAMMANLLEVKYGFARADIRILGVPDGSLGEGYTYLGDYATYKTLVKAIKALVAATTAGAFGVLYYSGHGASISDPLRPKEGLRQLTQYWITSEAEPFFDFEMELLTRGVQGKLALIFDCCHANGGARGMDTVLIKEGVLSESTVRPRLQSWTGKRPNPKEDILHTGDNRTLFYASEVGQSALEITLPHQGDPISVGAFTYCLYNALLHENNLTYGQAMSLIDERLKMLGRGLQTDKHFADAQNNLDGIALAPMPQGIAVPGSEKTTVPVGWLGGIFPGAILHDQKNNVYGRVRLARRFSAEVTGLSPKTERVSVSHQIYTRSSRSIQRKGNSDDEVVAYGIRLIIKEADTAGGWSVIADPGNDVKTSVVENLATKKEAEAEREKIAQGLVAIQELSETLFAYPDPLTLQLTTGESEKGIGYPRYHVSPDRKDPERGDQFSAKVYTTQPGYLLLLSCEPNGEIRVLYPNRESREPFSFLRIEKSMALPLVATPPYGISTLVAVVFSRPVTIPQQYLTLQAPNGAKLTHYEIPAHNVRAFLRWLGEAVSERKATLPDAITRGPGTLSGTVPTDIDNQRLIARGNLRVAQLTTITLPAEDKKEQVE
jgi:hypothetical protein